MSAKRDRFSSEIPFETESPEQARRRRRKSYEQEVYDRAIFIAQNDPDVNGDMRKARAKARELLALENRVDKGMKEGRSPEQTLRAEDRRRPRGRQGSRATPTGSRRKAGPSKPATRLRSTAKSVAAPFGSAASAGWTFFQGGLSIVLLYVVLRDADAIGDLVRGITAGIRRFTDPRIPLIPSREEVTPALSLVGGSSRANARRAAPVTSGAGPYANKPLVN